MWFDFLVLLFEGGLSLRALSGSWHGSGEVRDTAMGGGEVRDWGISHSMEPG